MVRDWSNSQKSTQPWLVPPVPARQFPLLGEHTDQRSRAPYPPCSLSQAINIASPTATALFHGTALTSPKLPTPLLLQLSLLAV